MDILKHYSEQDRVIVRQGYDDVMAGKSDNPYPYQSGKATLWLAGAAVAFDTKAMDLKAIDHDKMDACFDALLSAKLNPVSLWKSALFRQMYKWYECERWSLEKLVDRAQKLNIFAQGKFS